jgi:serine/threonine-protein kinase
VSVSSADFWKLLTASRLVSSQQAEQLAGEFAQAQGSQPATAKAAAQWLLGRKAVTRYQATVLLSGKTGPFFFGEYKVLERIEEGRFSGCFRAVHVPTGQPVMLQFLTGATATDPRLWNAAVSNVKAACNIASAHLQRFFEVVDLQKVKFLVGEDLRGKTLDEVAGGQTPRRVAPADACRVVYQVAVGLAELHRRGRTHGEVRPANIWLSQVVPDRPPHVKLLFAPHQTPQPVDFSQQQPDSRFTLAADYLAPELSAPGRAPDASADVYALGCTLYGLLSGAPPFAGGDLTQKMARHATEPIKPLAKVGLAAVPGGLEELLASMLAKAPAQRLGTAAVVEQLAKVIGPKSLNLPAPAPLPTQAAYENIVRPRMEQLAAPISAPPIPPVVEKPLSELAEKVIAPATTTAPTAGPVIQLSIEPKKAPSASADEILRRRAVKRRRQMIVGLAATLLVAVSAVTAAAWWWKDIRSAAAGIAYAPASADRISAAKAGGTPVTPASTGTVTAVDAKSSGKSPSSADNSAGDLHLLADDGQTLWASPTGGQAVDFRCIPPEGQIYLITRPADLLASPEGQRVLSAMGPAFPAWRAAWESDSGVKLEAIEQLIVTFHNNDAKFPRTSFVVRTKVPIKTEELLSKWGNPAAVQEMSQTYYTGSFWAYYIPASDSDQRTFAMAEPRDIKEVAASSGAPPVLFREIERLRRTTDDQRHLTVLFFPQFFFNDDGEPLFAAERAKVRQPLAWLLGDHLQAAAVSLHCGEQFYFETRMLGSLDKEPYELAQELRARLNEIPQAIESYVDRLAPPQYWSRVARRYPLMIGQLHQQMRVGVENEQAIVNSVLPTAAAHNLVLGGELLIATAPSASAAVVTSAEAPSGPKTIEEVLQLKTTFSFDQQSLEFAMRDLAEDVKGNLKNAPLQFEIKILGDDLKLDGITRNQSIRDFKQENQTVADILTALVRKANPVTTVKDASEPDQKLVWVIGPDPESPGRQVILITTRAAAAAKKLQLPPPFVIKKT